MEYVHIEELNTGIRLVLQMTKEDKEVVQQFIKDMDSIEMKNDNPIFPRVWANYVDESTEYTCYMIYNGARKEAKSLNITDCLFVYDNVSSNYTVYVSYAGD